MAHAPRVRVEHGWVGAAAVIAISLLALASAFAQSTTPPLAQAGTSTDAAPATRQLPNSPTQIKPWVGDLDGMLERRAIRIFAPHSRSLYFNDKGRERGLSAGLARDFEEYLNRKYKAKLGKGPLTVMIVAQTRDRLLPGLLDGLADVAIGDLTITEERLKLVDMVELGRGAIVQEILLTGPKSPAIAGIDDLSGKTVHVRRSSSYYESLVALNERFRGEGKAEVNLVMVPDALEDEDMMEMVEAGILEMMVVDDWEAKLWAPLLTKLVVHDDVVLRDRGRIGWAIRKQSPLLAAELKGFMAKFLPNEGAVASRIQELEKRQKKLMNPTESAGRKRFEQTLALFEKYGAQYRFDPLMLTAQGYQESQLDQNARSHVGAVGVMQIMPATGAQMHVGNIREMDANIHAGTKYMDQLMGTYFADAALGETDRTLMAFASYNCGPAAVATARKMAAHQGLDADRWFNNVEITTAKRCGAQTTTYVRNIYKYYVAYKLIATEHEQSDKAREAMAPAVDASTPQAGSSTANK